MVVKAKAEITISRIVDIEKTIRYYVLQGSTLATPSKPTANPPGGKWVTTEPAYTSGSTNTLYFVDLTIMTNGTYSYSDVSKSSSYEAAKAAYAKAEAAAKTATNYIKYTAADGLLVGNMSDATLKRNVQILSDKVNIRNGSTILASYSDDKICLGKNSKNSIIDLCDGSAEMSYITDSAYESPYFEMKTDENLRLSAVYKETDGRMAATGLNLRAMGYDGESNYADSHWDISSRIQDGDNSSLTMASGEAGIVWLYAIEKGEAQLKVNGTESTVEMVGKVAIRDSASDAVGCTITGGVGTFSEDVKTKSGASLKTLTPPKEYTYTTSGISVTVWESPLMIRIKTSGSPTGELATKSAYLTIASLKATTMTPVIKKIWVQTNYEVSLRVNAKKGKIEIGYSVKNGTSANIPSGTSINIDETFLLV